jgi:RimJ/RimL family protein N-acetyltransferase
MVKLEPLGEEDYRNWYAWQMDDYTQETIRAGLDEEAAREKAKSDMEGALPEGLQSKNTYLYSVQDETTGEKIGVLWLNLSERAGRKSIFIYDIVIWEPYRGKGYGTATMQALEDRARELGATRIALHVFGHNQVARNLYKKMGYIETNVNMAKDL